MVVIASRASGASTVRPPEPRSSTARAVAGSPQSSAARCCRAGRLRRDGAAGPPPCGPAGEDGLLPHGRPWPAQTRQPPPVLARPARKRRTRGQSRPAAAGRPALMMASHGDAAGAASAPGSAAMTTWRPRDRRGLGVADPWWPRPHTGLPGGMPPGTALPTQDLVRARSQRAPARRNLDVAPRLSERSFQALQGDQAQARHACGRPSRRSPGRDADPPARVGGVVSRHPTRRTAGRAGGLNASALREQVPRHMADRQARPAGERW